MVMQSDKRKNPALCEGSRFNAVIILIFLNHCSKNMFLNRQAVIGNTLYLSNIDIPLSPVCTSSSSVSLLFISEFSDNISDIQSL